MRLTSRMAVLTFLNLNSILTYMIGFFMFCFLFFGSFAYVILSTLKDARRLQERVERGEAFGRDFLSDDDGWG